MNQCRIHLEIYDGKTPVYYKPDGMWLSARPRAQNASIVHEQGVGEGGRHDLRH